MKILAVLFLLAGFFFTAVAAIGVLRFPDFYTRLHASGKGDTLGIALSLIGLAIYEGFSLVSLKLMFIVIFIFLANPIGTHVLARAAFRSGVKPWTKKGE
ncbi:MAG: monovalent cation/proton antiporter, MnhG/PhaG subunit [Peptococcaceae bacterium]|jgi:multicomponent Na+:H+ antiporter subunit G|uniref:Na+/H+ antiporter subunit G n=1 Tax=Thermanaerosceptrum fracticalcis TaxID=1712410 RepID=A0A7G6E4R3_THEFR|nr:monovalent cation/H(+) antiporter subunit G [Thermanaerosceptrum fracticalcis]MBZ4654704.1 monovalent cation/proton antiporter, MnhG/PhaG subunit [Peptococcaceae bacterium]QNB47067.1 Na+/H+ antiporter subunit G [Thermanaerosceptrum fracticalcis]